MRIISRKNMLTSLFSKFSFFRIIDFSQLNTLKSNRWKEMFFLRMDSSSSVLHKAVFKVWNFMLSQVFAIDSQMSTPVDIRG